MPKKNVETHESYGLVSFSRVTGKPKLFQNEVNTGSFIKLTIKRAEVHRELHRDWIFGRQELINVYLSNTQFAELLTTMNYGEGVPCTIDHVEGKRMAEPPTSKSQTETLKNETIQRMEDIAAEIRSKAEEVLTMVREKPTLNKADRAKIESMVNTVERVFNDKLTFALTSFEEATDRLTSKAKGEVEGFISHAVHRAGIEALSSGMTVNALGAGKDTDED